jgi:hypothetical protein
MQQSIRTGAWNERTISEVVSIRENFVDNFQSTRFTRARQLTSGGANKASFESNMAIARVTASARAGRAQPYYKERRRFGVRGTKADPSGDRLKYARVDTSPRRKLLPASPPILCAQNSRDRTDSVAVANGDLNPDGSPNAIRVSGMKSGRDIGRCHELEEFGIMTRPFSEVGVQIYVQNHEVWSLIPQRNC